MQVPRVRAGGQTGIGKHENVKSEKHLPLHQDPLSLDASQQHMAGKDLQGHQPQAPATAVATLYNPSHRTSECLSVIPPAQKRPETLQASMEPQLIFICSCASMALI